MKNKKKSKIVKAKDVFNLDFTKGLDEIEEQCKVKSLTNPKATPLYSEILTLNLKIGGGFRLGGWYEFFGIESSGKTTALYHVIAAALDQIPRPSKGFFINSEGTIDESWFKNITGKSTLDVFSKRDKEGNWIKPPIIRQYKPSFGERVLNLLKRALKKYPDKVEINDKWYYVFQPSTAKNIKKSGGYTKQQVKSIVKDFYDKKLSDIKAGIYYVPIPDNYSGPEFFIGVDSWATLVPESISEDDSSAKGSKARMYADYIDDIKALVILKGGVLVGINQLREKPMAFGNPEYSPGGNTLKHACDCRTQFRRGKDIIEDGDQYSIFRFKTNKNKLFVSNKGDELRWRTQNNSKTGDGIDKVIDTVQFLKETGQLKIVRGGYQISFIKKKLTYDKFKKILPKIRKKCFSQLKSGKAVKLYLEYGES